MGLKGTSRVQRGLAGLSAGFLAACLSVASSATNLSGGYSNVFALNNDFSKGAYQFGFGWDPANAGSGITQAGNTVYLTAQNITCNGNANDKDTVWGCDGSGPIAGYGKLIQDLLFFNEVTYANGDDPASGVWQGCFGANDLAEGYSRQAFVKVLQNGGNYDTYYEEYDGSGACYSIPWSIAGDADVILQRGVMISGPNGLADADYGSATVYLNTNAVPGAPEPGDPNAIPVLPLGGLLGMIALLGMFGIRRLT